MVNLLDKSLPQPFEYQKKNIEHCTNACINDGGTLICDGTGLGKTISALHVYFNLVEYYKDKAKKQPHLIIITPKNHRIAWKNELTRHGVLNYTLTTEGKIDTAKAPDIIIIDEAHNQRTVSSKGYQKVYAKIHKTRTALGYKPMVILLTATPSQNNIEELAATLSLIPFRADSPAYILLSAALTRAKLYKKEMDTLLRFHDEMESMSMITKVANKRTEMLQALRNVATVLPLFAVRNTEESIEKDYPNDLKMIGRFPKLYKMEIETNFNEQTRIALFKTLDYIDQLHFAYQNKIIYALKDKFTSMKGICKTFLLKRLDSSIAAFKESLGNTIKNIKSELIKPTEHIKHNEKEYKVDLIPYCNDLQQDLDIYEKIKNMWEGLDDSEKLNQLVDIVRQSLLTGGKVVIFTEYHQSFDIIFKRLKESFDSKRIIGFGETSGEAELNRIDANFNANNQTLDDADIVVTTDKLAEGTNMHVARTLVHWDLKWNPHTLTQRQGRIRRISLKRVNEYVTVHTFNTNTIIEKIIELQKTIGDKQIISDIILDFSHPFQFTHNPLWGLENTSLRCGDTVYYEWSTGFDFFHKDKYTMSYRLYHTHAGCIIAEVNSLGEISIDFNNQSKGYIFGEKNPLMLNNPTIHVSKDLLKNPTIENTKGEYVDSMDYLNVLLDDIGSSDNNESMDMKHKGIQNIICDKHTLKQMGKSGAVGYCTVNSGIIETLKSQLLKENKSIQNVNAYKDVMTELQTYLINENIFFLDVVVGNPKFTHYKTLKDFKGEYPRCVYEANGWIKNEFKDIFSKIQKEIGGKWNVVHSEVVDNNISLVFYCKKIIAFQDQSECKTIKIAKVQTQFGWDEYSIQIGKFTRQTIIEQIPNVVNQMLG